MRAFFYRYRHYFLLVLLYLLSELIVNPLGEFPLNDDWAYTKSVLFLHEGRVDIGEWPAMTLLTHLAWGALFTKLFGFSFFMLRFSSMISALAGVMVLFKIIRELGGSAGTGLAASLTLMFSPLYFNLGNTYMTDVNFNTLLLFSCYAAVRFFNSGSLLWFVAVMLLSVLLVLLRQFGIIVPVCFFAGILFMKNRKWHYFVLCFLGIAFTYLVLKGYESYLKTILPASAAYKFSGNISLLSAAFWNKLGDSALLRHGKILVHICLYCLPFTAAFLPALIRRSRPAHTVAAFMAGGIFSFLVLKDVPPQMDNVFMDMSLGAETWYETLNHTFVDHTHTWSATFSLCLELVKYLAATGTVAFLILSCIRPGQLFKKQPSPFAVLFLGLLCAYIFLILVTESYFDRYHIPVISLCLLIFAMCTRSAVFSATAFVVPLLFFAWISVFGTRDYFTVNRVRWKAYEHLHTLMDVPTQQINAGFEVNCWNEGKPTWWQNFLTLEYHNYLIQYQPEPGFKVMKQYPFRRTFPVRSDTITIYERIVKISP